VNLQSIEVLKMAIGRGFVHLDCADSYGTEREVGTAIRESGLPREKFFITTKAQDGFADVTQAIEKSLSNLQVDCVDL